MPSALERAARAWRQRLLAYERAPMQQLLQVYADSWLRLQAEIDRYTRRIAEGDPLTPGLLHRRRAAQDAQEIIAAEIERMNRAAASLTAAMQERAVSQAHQSIQEMVNAQVRVETYLRRPNFAATESLIGYASDGSPLVDVLASASRGQAAAMTNLLAQNVTLGINPLVTARQMRAQFGTVLRRAQTIARTETVRAFREAGHLSMQANDDVIDGWIWISALSARTCAACFAMHGTWHPSSEKLNGHPNCVVEGTMVVSPTILATSKRWFVGEVIEIRTANGNFLTVTPNHPILTPNGWVAAGFLKQGDDVISSLNPQATVALVDPDGNNEPALIEDIVESFRSAGGMTTRSVPTAPEDFHGDGVIDGEVSIVFPDSSLKGNIPSPLLDPLSKQTFGIGSMGLEALLPESALAQGFFGLRHSPNCVLSNFDSPEMLFLWGLGSEQLIRFSVSSDRDISLFQTAVDNDTFDLVLFSKGIDGDARLISSNNFVNRQVYAVGARVGVKRDTAQVDLFGQAAFGSSSEAGSPVNTVSGEVCVDGIVEYRRRDFSGHVYNLQTSTEWYIAGGIITHNCRCVMSPHVRGARRPVPNGEDRFRRLSVAQQRETLGRAKYNAWQDGAFDFRDLARTRRSNRWGNSVQVRSLTSLVGAEMAEEYLHPVDN